MKRIILIIFTLSSLITFSLSARSAELALDFTGTIANSFLYEVTFGWSFSVDQTVKVDALGFFDDEIRTGPDLNQDHLVSLWTIDGDLLAQTTITNASTPVASTAEGGEWLFNDIDPVILTAGEYVVSAFDPACTSTSDCDDIRYLDTASVSPLISFIEAVENPSGNGFPSNSIPERNDGYFGPNLRIEAIPVPAAAWLFGSGLIGLIGVARRKKA